MRFPFKVCISYSFDAPASKTWKRTQCCHCHPFIKIAMIGKSGSPVQTNLPSTLSFRRVDRMCNGHLDHHWNLCSIRCSRDRTTTDYKSSLHCQYIYTVHRRWLHSCLTNKSVSSFHWIRRNHHSRLCYRGCRKRSDRVRRLPEEGRTPCISHHTSHASTSYFRLAHNCNGRYRRREEYIACDSHCQTMSADTVSFHQIYTCGWKRGFFLTCVRISYSTSGVLAPNTNSRNCAQSKSLLWQLYSTTWGKIQPPCLRSGSFE